MDCCTTRADYTRFFRALSRYEQRNADNSALHGEVAEPERLSAWLKRYDDRLLREQSVDAVRHAQMLSVNPKFVLRNWMAQEAITHAEAGSYATIEELRSLLSTPFDEHPEAERYAETPPGWAKAIAVSCSS